MYWNNFMLLNLFVLLFQFSVFIFAGLPIYDPIQKKIDYKNTLGLGMKCNLTNEKHRQRIQKLMLQIEQMAMKSNFSDWTVNSINGDLQGTPPKLPPEVIEFNKQLSQLPGEFCNQSLFLTCSSTGACECADELFITGIKGSFQLNGNICVVKEGHACIPPAYNEIRSFLPCANTSRCLVKGNSSLCTMDIYKKQITENPSLAHRYDKIITGNRMIIDLGAVAKILSKEHAVCICSGHPQIPLDRSLDIAIAILFLFTILNQFQN